MRLLTGTLLLCIGIVGCGGGASSGGSASGGGSTPPPPTPAPPPDVSGAWSFVFTNSNYTAGNFLVIEANLTKQSDNEYFSTAGTTILFTGTADPSSDGSIDGVAFGGPCDNQQINGGPNKQLDAFNLTFTDQLTAIHSVNALNLVAPAKTAYTGTFHFSPDGKSLQSGDYVTPPGSCTPMPTSGSVTGQRSAPFSGTYAGTLLTYCGETVSTNFNTHTCNNNNTPEPVVLNITEDNETVLVTGSSNNMPIQTSGTHIGGAFMIAGFGDFAGGGPGNTQQEGSQLIGIYDPVANNFRIYSWVDLHLGTQQGLPVDEEFIGILHAGSAP